MSTSGLSPIHHTPAKLCNTKTMQLWLSLTVIVMIAWFNCTLSLCSYSGLDVSQIISSSVQTVLYNLLCKSNLLCKYCPTDLCPLKRISYFSDSGWKISRKTSKWFLFMNVVLCYLLKWRIWELRPNPRSCTLELELDSFCLFYLRMKLMHFPQSAEY